jgi:hypothetical protein
VERIRIERIGGFAGFGLPGSRLRSKADLAASDLSPDERRAIEDLFAAKKSVGAQAPDSFRYRITHESAGGTKTIEAAEADVPASLKSRVRDVIE